MFEYKALLFIKADENIHIERLAGVCDCQHTHDFWELVFIEEGIMVQIIDNKPYKVSAGSLLIILPGHTHSFFSMDAYKTFYINFYIRNDFAADLLKYICIQSGSTSTDSLFSLLEKNMTTPIVNLNTEVQKQHYIDIIDTLRIFTEKQHGYKEATNDFLRRIFLYLNGEISRPASSNSESTHAIPEAILESVEKSFPYTDLSGGNIASKLNYNKDYITRKFKSYISLTIDDYIQVNKMNIAMHLLWQTDLPIDKICEQVGYKNKYYFYKIFKQYFGITPAKLRTFYLKKLSSFQKK